MASVVLDDDDSNLPVFTLGRCYSTTSKNRTKKKMSDSEEETTTKQNFEEQLMEEEEVPVEEEQDLEMQESKNKKKSKIVQDHSGITAHVEIHMGPDASVSTYIFHKESHTMGNALRHVLMQNKKVSFCGYTVPHPLEAKMNLRLQTVDEKYPAKETLEESLINLQQITETVMDKFSQALDSYHQD